MKHQYETTAKTYQNIDNICANIYSTLIKGEKGTVSPIKLHGAPNSKTFGDICPYWVVNSTGVLFQGIYQSR